MIGFIFMLTFFATEAFAWGQKGHRIIAEVAAQYMTTKARKKTDALLGHHGLVYWSNFADEIKSDTIYRDSYDWHFQDLDAGLSDSVIVAMRADYPSVGGRLFEKLDSLTDVLRYHPNDTAALWFVVHLMGDYYCPMHMAHLADKGGNMVKIKWFNERTNLHAVWDSKLIEARGYSYSEYVQFLMDVYGSERRVIEQKTEAELLLDNYNLCNAIYAYQTDWNGNTYHYVYHWHAAMEHQLYTAAVRLAKRMNEIYK